MPDHTKVAIIGSGPAGLTAAIYAARANLAPILVEGIPDRPLNDLPAGGQLMLTTDVENYPGFPKGVAGPEMMDLFRAQAERFGTRIVAGNVTSVDLAKRPFTLAFDDGTITCDALIVATGASAKLLGIESEQTLFNFGVSACATCDGALHKGKEMIVVGGGDTAMEEAIYLTRLSPRVTVVHRRDSLRASKIMQERARANERIAFRWNAVIEEIVAAPDARRVAGVRVRDVVTGARETIPAGAVFIAIGHKPNTDLFSGKLAMDETGYLKVEPGSTRTSVPGVFAAGDCADRVYRQAVTAAGTGCMAALDAERFLSH